MTHQGFPTTVLHIVLWITKLYVDYDTKYLVLKREFVIIKSQT